MHTAAGTLIITIFQTHTILSVITKCFCRVTHHFLFKDVLTLLHKTPPVTHNNVVPMYFLFHEPWKLDSALF